MTAKKMYEFEHYEGKVRGVKVYRFRFIASNGNIVGHNYNTLQAAEKSREAFLAAVREGRIFRKAVKKPVRPDHPPPLEYKPRKGASKRSVE